MRIFTPEVLVRDFAELGFGRDERERWERMIGEPNGIVLVTGPTGSGKTTTVAKLANLLKRQGRRVLIGACDTFRAAAIEMPLPTQHDDARRIEHSALVGRLLVLRDRGVAGHPLSVHRAGR